MRSCGGHLPPAENNSAPFLIFQTQLQLSFPQWEMCFRVYFHSSLGRCFTGNKMKRPADSVTPQSQGIIPHFRLQCGVCL